jgi:hypothetical protein
VIDHRKLAGIVVDALPPPEKLGRGRGASDGGEPMDDEGGSDMGGEEAVKAFFSLGKSGDYSGAYKALGQAVRMCQDDGDGDESN